MDKSSTGNKTRWYRFKCPRCGGTKFRFFEYVLTSYEFDKVYVNDNGYLEPDWVGVSEPEDDVIPYEYPYQCMGCDEVFDESELELILVPKEEIRE